MMNRIILASASPRRRELLQRIVPEFEIIPARGEERSDAADPRDYVRELAMHKAREVMRAVSLQNTTASEHLDTQDENDTIYVIGADTIVVCDHEIMGKPHDREDAYRMIHELQGRCHEVMTGVCVLRRGANAEDGLIEMGSHGVGDGRILRDGDTAAGAGLAADQNGIAMDAFTCVTEVAVAPMTDAEIRRYLATGEADDKAGAYGIQGAFSLYVTGIHGSYSNVVGLPVAALYQSLRGLGGVML